MAASTIEIILILGLTILVGVGIWWLAVAGQYRGYLDNYVYARGAHATSGGQTVTLKCDSGKKIYIDKATQICTIPDHNNFESSHLEPISSGLEGTTPYGAFNPGTTVDLTKVMGGECNGKTECTYTFKPELFPNQQTCPSSNTQLISTYVCSSKPIS
jgi:hypothetical protein